MNKMRIQGKIASEGSLWKVITLALIVLVIVIAIFGIMRFGLLDYIKNIPGFGNRSDGKVVDYPDCTGGDVKVGEIKWVTDGPNRFYIFLKQGEEYKQTRIYFDGTNIKVRDKRISIWNWDAGKVEAGVGDDRFKNELTFWKDILT